MSFNEYPMLLGRDNFNRAQTDDVAVRAQQKENSSRTAYQRMSYITTGVGQITSSSPQMFDTTFTEPPVITSGSVMLTPPGPGWRYPQTSAGVYRWITNDQGFFVGAHLYFVVDCNPENPDDETTIGLTPQQIQIAITHNEQLENELEQATPPDEPQLAFVKMELLKHKLALRRAQRTQQRKPPKPRIEHHLVFQGTATKQLPASVMNQL